MSGVGKTILAAAVIEDPEVRAAFPRGFIWLTLGRTPDLLSLQQRLLGWAAPKADPPTEIQAGRDALDTALKSQRWLIVLDDVWRPADLRAFEVADTPSRLLITTRDKGIVRASGAIPHEVEELTQPAARAFLAKAVGMAEPDLPPAAAEVIKQCGRLPLALALAGATLADAPREAALWRDVVAALTAADHEQLSHEFDYPYPHALAAIQASVDALPPEDRTAYLQLAIFPEDMPIPLAPLRKLWQITGLKLQSRVSLIVDRALARRQESGAIVLHDLQHDFVRKRCADVQAAHTALLDGYRADAPVGGWAELMHDGYVHGQLLHHLKGAGRTDELRALLLDARWLSTRLKSAGTVGMCAAYDQHSSDDKTRLVGDAIRMSLHVLEQDPEQLASQLAGRLGNFPYPDIRCLLAQALGSSHEPLLLPRRATLTQPGEHLRQTLTGHGLALNAVAVTPDGKRAISSSYDALNVWNLEEGRLEGRLECDFDSVSGLAITPDGKRAIAGSYDGLNVWDVESRRLETRFEVHGAPVRAVAIMPDGKRALSDSGDGALKVWDLTTGDSTSTLAGHEDWVADMGVMADGRAVSTLPDGKLKLTSPEEEGLTAIVWENSDELSAVAVTPDRKWAIAGSSNGSLKVWNFEEGRLVATLGRHSDGVLAVAVTPDGKRAISGSCDGTLKVWDLEPGRLRATVERHSDRVSAVAVTPDGKRAISGSRDGTLKIWDVQGGRLEGMLEGHGGEVMAVAMTPDGKRAISGSRDETLKVWDLQARRLEAALQGGGHAVAVTPDGQRAISSHGGKLEVWDLTLWVRTASLDEGGGDAVALSRDGKRAISATSGTCGGPATVQVSDLQQGRLDAIFPGHHHVAAVTVSSDGKWAILGADGRMGSGALDVWELDTAQPPAQVVDAGVHVTAVAMTPDGKRAISGSRDGALKVWDIASRKCLASFHSDTAVTAVAAARDGVLVAGDGSGAVHILQCLSAIPKAEAHRVLDAIERKIRHQISTFRGHAIATRRAGSVCRFHESPSGKLFFMVALNILSEHENIGIACFSGFAVLDEFRSPILTIDSIDCDFNADYNAWFGTPSQFHYTFYEDEEFSIDLFGGDERHGGDSMTERFVREYQIHLHEPINWPEHGGSRVGISLRGKVTSKVNWRLLLEKLKLENNWLQMYVRGPCPWDG